MTQINSRLKISFIVKIFLKHTSHNQCVPASFSRENYSGLFYFYGYLILLVEYKHYSPL